jgi:nucleoside-diphosphate-sugar epimerase
MRITASPKGVLFFKQFLGMEVILMTGSTGFIGSHLAAKLDRYLPIPHDAIGLSHLPEFDRFFFLSTYGNLATHEETDLIVKANVTDLITVLKQIDLRHNFKSFTFVSTSSVRLKRQTMYSRTKKAAEEVLLSYLEKYDVPICIVRPFSVTGVGEQRQHLIPKLIRSCLEGERMDFVPNAVHDFIDVDDVVEGLLNLSSHGARGVFELGSGIAHTNDQVKEIVEKVTGQPANVDIVDKMRDYDNQEWVSGNFRARMYGWLNRITLEQSITNMVEEYKNGKK